MVSAQQMLDVITVITTIGLACWSLPAWVGSTQQGR